MNDVQFTEMLVRIADNFVNAASSHKSFQDYLEDDVLEIVEHYTSSSYGTSSVSFVLVLTTGGPHIEIDVDQQELIGYHGQLRDSVFIKYANWNIVDDVLSSF